MSDLFMRRSAFLRATVNPQTLVARTNVARAAAGLEYDAGYAASLGADAVPTLVRLMPRLGVEHRCILQGHLQAREEQARERDVATDWRVWNFGDWRARRALRSLPGTARTRAPQVPSPTPAQVNRKDPE